MPAADFHHFLDRLIADDASRALLRAAANETEFTAQALALARDWSMTLTADELQEAGRAAARRWLERML
jgi:hypothetical protein